MMIQRIRMLWLLFAQLLIASSWLSTLTCAEEPKKRPAPNNIAAHKTSAWCLAFSPDSTMVATGSSDKTVKLWEIASGKHVATLDGHPGSVWSVAFSPDGKLLASGTAIFDEKGKKSHSGEISIWDVGRRTLIDRVQAHDEVIRGLSFAPDGKLLASAAQDGLVKLWKVANEKLTLLQLVYDAQTVHPSAVKRGPRLRNTVVDVAFSPEGTLLAWGEDPMLWLWDVEKRTERFVIQVTDIHCLAFSQDGRLVASGAHDGRDVQEARIKLWDVATGKELTTLSGAPSPPLTVAFAKDGNSLASGHYDGAVRIWDRKSGKHKDLLPGNTKYVQGVRFSPDGRTLGAVRWDGVLQLWSPVPSAID